MPYGNQYGMRFGGAGRTPPAQPTNPFANWLSQAGQTLNNIVNTARQVNQAQARTSMRFAGAPPANYRPGPNPYGQPGYIKPPAQPPAPPWLQAVGAWLDKARQPANISPEFRAQKVAQYANMHPPANYQPSANPYGQPGYIGTTPVPKTQTGNPYLENYLRQQQQLGQATSMSQSNFFNNLAQRPDVNDTELRYYFENLWAKNPTPPLPPQAPASPGAGYGWGGWGGGGGGGGGGYGDQLRSYFNSMVNWAVNQPNRGG